MFETSSISKKDPRPLPMEGHLSWVASDALQGHEAMLVALVEGGG